ncbi:hypothetical protein D5281_14125 [bacterium 1xD42-62]|uniref:Uncharacterized protein n=1 Tax=Parablautia muri TaxID=2320879 RepID=A0A9X5BIW3_9FIRM|nr:hypothetical protein [Parablautia muri]
MPEFELKEGMSSRLCACREYFYRFSSVIIHPYWKFAAVTNFRYVSGVLPVSIIVINKKTITVSRLIYPFDTTYHGVLLEIVKNCILKSVGEKMTSENKSNSSSLKERLEGMEKNGVKLYLNGVPSTTDYIIKNCVNEDTIYMPDYVTDEHGKVTEIRYDRISTNDAPYLKRRRGRKD